MSNLQKNWSKYIYILNGTSCAQTARPAINSYFWVIDRHGSCLQTLLPPPPSSPPVSFILLHILNPIHVCLGLQLETFYQHCHVLLDNVKWIFKIAIFVRAVMLDAIEIGFKTSIWCCILTHIFFWLKILEKMPTLILLNPQVYQAPESVMMNQSVHKFYDLGISYVYRIKAISWITADYLQWKFYVKTKSLVYMCKKLSRPCNPS